MLLSNLQRFFQTLAMADGYFCLEEGYIHCGTEKLAIETYKKFEKFNKSFEKGEGLKKSL